MPSKTTKKARRAGVKPKSNIPEERDDGTRWYVMSGIDFPHRKMYGGKAYTKREAERLAEGLLHHGYIEQAPD